MKIPRALRRWESYSHHGWGSILLQEVGIATILRGQKASSILWGCVVEFLVRDHYGPTLSFLLVTSCGATTFDNDRRTVVEVVLMIIALIPKVCLEAAFLSQTLHRDHLLTWWNDWVLGDSVVLTVTCTSWLWYLTPHIRSCKVDLLWPQLPILSSLTSLALTISRVVWLLHIDYHSSLWSFLYYK